MNSLYPTLLALVLAATAAHAQNVGLGTTTPNAAAALDITAAGKGLLIPRMDSATRAAIASPPAGLLVYQSNGRTGFWYYTGTAWAFIPDKLRSGDNLGNHSATQALGLNSNQLRLKAPTDSYHVLQYSGDYDGPLAYGYGGGALGYTSNGSTVTPALRWTRDNNVSVDLAGANAGTAPDLSFGGAGYGEGIGSARAANSPNQYGLDFYTASTKRLTIGNGGIVGVGVAGTNTGTAPDLAFGGSSTGEGVGSARNTGNPNQYGLDFYTGFNKRLSIANGGNVGVATTAPSSTLHANGSFAVGLAMGLAGSAAGTRLGDSPSGYVGLAPNGSNDYYLLPAATACPGRVYYIRNNSDTTPARLSTEQGYIYEGGNIPNTSTPFVLQTSGLTKTITAISDGQNWTVLKNGN